MSGIPLGLRCFGFAVEKAVCNLDYTVIFVLKMKVSALVETYMNIMPLRTISFYCLFH